ncbi:hypothetical protein [Umezawaea tangerina]|uniref:Uncharacterized protein n=1 Tax=Umezawaea tangerina TaxID=84725 RepID=A0A2T0SS87_9PSEU|nr:hypothetical protein [Umezawaea tangerina]PRY36277.1 hypothetical protein CLV43_112204 [Umezawaea tangerina]
MNIPDPVGTNKPCHDCGQPTVEARTGTGTTRVHCGTFATRCHTPARTR